MRAMNLTDELLSKGHRVVLWTSDFDHFSKKSRFGTATTITHSNLLTIKLIPSIGYKAHKSLVRFWDHLQLACNLRKMLRGQIPPDVAFVGLPPIESAWVISHWLKKHRIPFLADIKDTWPENYVDLFPKKIRFVGKLVFAPLFGMRNWIMRNANGVVSITNDFLAWARVASKTTSKGFDYVAPLVPSEKIHTNQEELAAEDWLDRNHIMNDGTPRAYFVGSLNSVFDFEPILFAAKKLSIEFVICGEGPLRLALENQFRGIKNVKFLGWVNQTQSDALARRSTFALAPVRDRQDFNMSVPNKFYDAIRHGNPIIATDHGVSAEFIKSNRIGACYDGSDVGSLATTIESLLHAPGILAEMSNASENLFRKSYNYSKVYGDLLIHIQKLVSKAHPLDADTRPESDKEFEIRKYAKFASNEMIKGEAELKAEQPLEGIPPIHLPPYLEYINQLNNLIKPNQEVLELGAGTGKITSSLISLGAKITAVDISAESLGVLRMRSGGKVKTVLADIEKLPFQDNSFDVLISSGSLSYGSPSIVDSEIRRVLKPYGSIVILDSLNHNPIYKMNRYFSFVRGYRTRKSIETIPNLERVVRLTSMFESSKASYFGQYLWLYPFLKTFTTQQLTNRIMDRLGQAQGSKKMAFKFVLIGEKLIK
jgi:ubiquinone/menaquinone biosynthesis C-methylase UbiE/glycosyltransferase involved in cell wall biosynthesis